jgi:hypothetical protein
MVVKKMMEDNNLFAAKERLKISSDLGFRWK